jgi:hypothetical protein
MTNVKNVSEKEFDMYVHTKLNTILLLVELSQSEREEFLAKISETYNYDSSDVASLYGAMLEIFTKKVLSGEVIPELKELLITI